MNALARADEDRGPRPPLLQRRHLPGRGIAFSQYHPTFDQAFVESFPYSSSAADSNPSATATATPAELGLFLDNYPTGACLISTFSPYCDQIQKMPLDTYFARATSDSKKANDARTSFPCEPGQPEPKTVVIGPPNCTQSPATPLETMPESVADWP